VVIAGREIDKKTFGSGEAVKSTSLKHCRGEEKFAAYSNSEKIFKDTWEVIAYQVVKYGTSDYM